MRRLTEMETELAVSSLHNLAESRELLARVNAVHASLNAVQVPLLGRPFAPLTGKVSIHNLRV